MEQRIPAGKHKGRLLSELTDTEVSGMNGAWQDSKHLRKHPFIKTIRNEHRRRKANIVTASESSQVSLPYGRFADVPIVRVPTAYLNVIAKSSPNAFPEVLAELERRKLPEPVEELTDIDREFREMFR